MRMTVRSPAFLLLLAAASAGLSAAASSAGVVLVQLKADRLALVRSGNQSGDASPRMLVMLGCSGSTEVIFQSRTFLSAHGITPSAQPEFPKSEMLKSNKNIFYEEAGHDMGKAMQMTIGKAQSMQPARSLIFKGMIEELAGENDAGMWDKVSAVLKNASTHAVFATRQNMLDQLICEVKDCFSPEFGVPVDENGVSHLQSMETCIKRRAPTTDDEKAMASYKAKLDPGKLVRGIDKLYRKVDSARRVLQRDGFAFSFLTTEDLFAYEESYAPEAFDQSLKAWIEFLESWGVDPNERKIREVLKQRQGSYHTPAPHRDVIYNLEEVKEVLKGTKYASFIRD